MKHAAVKEPEGLVQLVAQLQMVAQGALLGLVVKRVMAAKLLGYLGLIWLVDLSRRQLGVLPEVVGLVRLMKPRELGV
jgi:nucleoside permease NupC